MAYLDGLHELKQPVPPDVESVTVGLGEASEAAVYKVAIEEAAPVG